MGFRAAAAAVALWFGTAVAGQLSPAERAMEQARAAIEAQPANHEAHNALALALARRARETADTAFYDQAGAAVRRSLALAPDNFQARKLEVWLLLGRHEFAKALPLARELNRRMPDDPMVYGFITDACVELGEYEEAEKAAQWMLDLGRASVPGLTRAAYLRELFGDIDGAVELMTMAYGKVDPAEVEDRAWILTQMAHLRIESGELEMAEGLLEQALAQFPGYHYALANVGRLRTAQGRFAEAADVLRRRYRAAPHPENLFDLAAALDRAGRRAEARRAFAEFEAAARKEMSGADNANRELIFFYADYAGKPGEALAVARSEIQRRRDVHTVDAYSWALYRSGQTAEARRQIETVLKVGIRDPKILHHAGAIARAAAKPRPGG